MVALGLPFKLRLLPSARSCHYTSTRMGSALDPVCWGLRGRSRQKERYHPIVSAVAAGEDVARAAILVASLLGPVFSGIDEERVDPFTLYGSVKKKYLIEHVESGKIVGRSPGFTVKACVGAVRQSEETPQMQSTPIGMRQSIEGKQCATSEVPTSITASSVASPALRKEAIAAQTAACSRACADASRDAIARHQDVESSLSGIILDPSRVNTVQESCARRCMYANSFCSADSAIVALSDFCSVANGIECVQQSGVHEAGNYWSIFELS